MIPRAEFLRGLGGTGTALAGIDLPNFAAQVQIAVIAPFSGDQRRNGEQLGNGVRAAIDDTNRQRGGLDRVYTLRTFDDRNGIADAIVNAQFAAADPSIVAVVGHLGAKSTAAAVRTYAEAQLPLIVPAATADDITANGYRNVFRLPTRDFDEGQLLARYVLSENKPKVAHALVQDGDYGSGVAEGFVQTLTAQKVDAKATVFPYANADFGKVAAETLARKPDAIALTGYAAEMGPIVKELRDRGFGGALVASQGFFDALVTTKYAKECEGIVISTSMPYLAIAPSAFRIRADFQARYGALTPVSAFGYAAAQVVISAVRRTGAQQRAQLLRALTLGSSFDTLVGSFTFGPRGDPIDPEVYFYTVRDGKFAYVRQAHPSSFLPR